MLVDIKHESIFNVAVNQRRVVESRLNVNVALKRPSWQSSFFCYNGVCYSADKGNDGDTYTADVHRTCLVTYTEKHP